jgi:ABC-type uncharacterized transport system YnjBCD ATPase subunit
MVFRDTTLVPFLDVAANLTRSAEAFGVPEPEAAQRVASRSRLLGLVRLLRRLPRTLSAGESGLAGIGRTLVRTPRAFLFDEPLAHLDATERVRLAATSRNGTSVVSRKTMETSRCATGIPVTSRPATSTRPRCTGCSPATALSAVVLPLPDGPTTASTSPGCASSVTPRSAGSLP